jgi:toxin CcdB
MARFDVFKTADGAYVVDYQSDMLDYLHTRFVIPLFPPEIEPKISERLNPVFVIGGERYVLYPQFAASITQQELKEHVTSLADDDFAIIGAFDMLTTGY